MEKPAGTAAGFFYGDQTKTIFTIARIYFIIYIRTYVPKTCFAQKFRGQGFNRPDKNIQEVLQLHYRPIASEVILVLVKSAPDVFAPLKIVPFR